jgi:hypothetical protein
MTFDELIETKEEYVIDGYEVWDDSNKMAAWIENEDCSIDLLQWYLALILRSVDLENMDREMGDREAFQLRNAEWGAEILPERSAQGADRRALRQKE